ncbi:uncharacterized protein LOC143853797 [Tasmannia lanceolata]|uniref:uncharacterized protein LOC143853797 n=1 Tax=Tasmannia lanceolata TaxID=3420 RepID=UPI0040649EE9
MPEKPCHVLSISMPTRSHLFVSKVQEEIEKLKTWETLPKSSSTICIGLSGLKDLYNCVEDLLQLPLTQQVLFTHQQEKWMEEMLDGSVRLLDMCGITRDILIQMKGQVVDLNSALRRSSNVEGIIGAYIC